MKEIEVKVKNAKKGKGEKGKKKASIKVVMTVEKVNADEPIPNLVQTRISVAPSGKVLAEKPSEAAEKSAKEVEEDRLAELARVDEAEKVRVVVQLAKKNKIAEAAIAAHAELDEAEEVVRQQLAKATTNADAINASEDAEDDIPLTRRRTKVSAAMRKPMRKRDFILSAHELEDVIPEEAEEEEREEAVNDNEDLHMDVDAKNFNDDGAPIIENLSEDSTPEQEDFDEVLNIARAVTEDDPNFMDDVLLGQGRSYEGHRNVHEVFDRMSHLFSEPLSVAPSATFNPNAPENSKFSAPEDATTSAPEQVIHSPEHNSPTPSHPHSSSPISVTQAGDSHTSIPPTTSTSEVVKPLSLLDPIQKYMYPHLPFSQIPQQLQHPLPPL
ncbi:hypothetical protein M5689_003396 [Euphorbia peplus]|nr:hypothetical protein M5689_003396 [Euphorbia peplus]